MKFDIDKLDIGAITAAIKAGTTENLPAAYQEYYNIMDLVRGLKAKGRHKGQIITTAAIIKLLKSKPYNLTDYTARKVYADAINFFYADSSIHVEAWRNLYAERLDKLHLLAVEMGNLDMAHKYLVSAAKLRKCFEPTTPEVPEEMLRKPVVVYSMDIADIGRTPMDKAELEKLIDSMPDLPSITRERIKMEAQIVPFSLEASIDQNLEEFTDSQN